MKELNEISEEYEKCKNLIKEKSSQNSEFEQKIAVIIHFVFLLRLLEIRGGDRTTWTQQRRTVANNQRALPLEVNIEWGETRHWHTPNYNQSTEE